MYRLKKLPYKNEFNSIHIYKYLSDANFCIGELKGLLESTPNLSIVLKYLNLFEAKMSADIEGIHTDYRSIFLDNVAHKQTSTNSVQVVNQMRATNILYNDVKNKGKLIMEDINRIQEFIVPNNPGLRHVRGHKIYNKVTNEVLYIPPQNKLAIVEYFQNLIDYINTKESKYDPLIKTAIIHYQFKCIEPYHDGNGRVGRIINIMSLVLSKRLNYPILNLSNYCYQNREEYFALLEKCHNDINYLDEFIIYVLQGILETSSGTINRIYKINTIIDQAKEELKKTQPSIYSDELIDHLFMYPYTKNELVRNSLNLSRSTTTKYLKTLVDIGFLDSIRYGKETIYINKHTIDLFNTETNNS
jgi:Fic family protein